MTSHAALTASPRLSATIANETAPNRAIAVHKTFVCHAELLKVAPIDSSRTAAGLFWNHFSNRPTERAIQIRVTNIAACRSKSWNRITGIGGGVKDESE